MVYNLPPKHHSKSRKNNLNRPTLQTLQEQLPRRAILLIHIAMPNPMHALPQLFRQPLRISLDARRAHGEQHARLPTSLDDALGPRATNLVVGVEDVGELLGGGGSGWVGEEVFEDEGVLERLAGALALPGGGGVRGVAEQGDAALGEGGGDRVVEDGPFGELGAFEEL